MDVCTLPHPLTLHRKKGFSQSWSWVEKHIWTTLLPSLHTKGCSSQSRSWVGKSHIDYSTLFTSLQPPAWEKEKTV